MNRADGRVTVANPFGQARSRGEFEERVVVLNNPTRFALRHINFVVWQHGFENRMHDEHRNTFRRDPLQLLGTKIRGCGTMSDENAIDRAAIEEQLPRVRAVCRIGGELPDSARIARSYVSDPD